MNDWAAQHLAELHARAPVKRKKQDRFVMVPLWFAVEATKATKTPAALVWIELLDRSWRTKSLTFSLPNGRLNKNGVSREIKRRALRDLEAAGLITVERRHGKTVQVTLVLL